MQSEAAVGAAYDAVAADYARLVPDLTVEAPLDRAVLAAFAELVRERGDVLVADVGCGTARVTAHLDAAGLRTVGFDLSPGMAAVGLAQHGGLALAAARAGQLPLRDRALGGLLAWYSLIHLPPAALPAVLAELARVLAAGSPLLVAFQSGDGQRVDRTTSYERPVALSYYRHRADEVAALLEPAGFDPYATVTRAPVLSFESTPQTFLLATRRS